MCRPFRGGAIRISACASLLLFFTNCEDEHADGRADHEQERAHEHDQPAAQAVGFTYRAQHAQRSGYKQYGFGDLHRSTAALTRWDEINPICYALQMQITSKK